MINRLEFSRRFGPFTEAPWIVCCNVKVRKNVYSRIGVIQYELRMVSRFGPGNELLLL
jgi:hypothetical protein